MLLSLRIENFALIDRLELAFPPGIAILTGETGAGKSIVLDALDVALGGKTSARMLRTGTTKAAIEAEFGLHPFLADWLQTQEIETEGELVCSREITARSSRHRVNGVLMTKAQTQELRGYLLEIAAQGQAAALASPTARREWLDRVGGPPLAAALQTQRELFRAWKEAKEHLETHLSQTRDRQLQRDLWEFQRQELEAAALTDRDELTHLEKECRRLARAADLQQQARQAYGYLYEGHESPAAVDLLGKALHSLVMVTELDERANGCRDLVENALVQIEEAARFLRDYEDTEHDPDRLTHLESRRQQLKQICRKYGPTLPEAIARYQQLTTDLAALDSQTTTQAELVAAVAAARAALDRHSDGVHHLRQQAATQLAAQMQERLPALALERARFQVELTPTEPTAYGGDRVTFWFSANPGEPLQPLSETASGGEISRFLLALKTCLALPQGDTPLPTLVFDEIDVGVSGRVARAIAAQLCQLGRHTQVLCVTHQPIVAAIADAHFRVSKQVVGDRTQVEVTRLSPAECRQELALMAGGEIGRGRKKSTVATDFAEALLTEAAALRQTS
ncbi:MAG TPA: DNA repair protein RecN [Cyanobacteria bacterium UBA8156]|jgi:DNA repair protein RecN (Recombination protein N)|nr:DNA repair protein RecN [Cyanobacteria bacterium UBA8156]